MKTKFKKSAFTLIELLVVITIIGILAGIALPVYSSIQERGEQTKALSNAKQIGLALKLYAGDYNGAYPNNGSVDPETGTAVAALADANAGLRLLIPNYVPNEAIFWLSGSGWCTPAPPNENATGNARLEPGENHWAYTRGLRETSNPRLPIIADGFSGTVGTYAATEGAQGAIWKGRRAVVIRVDQSGAIENLNASFELMEQHAGSNINIFTQGPNWLGTAVVLNPTPRP